MLLSLGYSGSDCVGHSLFAGHTTQYQANAWPTAVLATAGVISVSPLRPGRLAACRSSRSLTVGDSGLSCKRRLLVRRASHCPTRCTTSAFHIRSVPPTLLPRDSAGHASNEEPPAESSARSGWGARPFVLDDPPYRLLAVSSLGLIYSSALYLRYQFTTRGTFPTKLRSTLTSSIVVSRIAAAIGPAELPSSPVTRYWALVSSVESN